MSFNKETKKKKIKIGQQEPDSEQTNLCNFLPKDTVNAKSLQWLKWATVNYMKKKISVGYWKYVLSIFSAESPSLKNGKELEESIIYITRGFVLILRHLSKNKLLVVIEKKDKNSHNFVDTR